MCRRSITVLILLCSFLNLPAQDDASSARWMKQPAVIDGNDNDWGEPLNFFDNASGMIFSLANDGKNVYLCFSNNDRSHALKMMVAGWTVELSSSEKKRKFEVTFSFPKINDPSLTAQADMKNVVNSYRSLLPAVEVKGLLSNTGSIPLNAKQGVEIAIGTDSTERIVYEVKIPVKELMEEDKLQLNELITLNITINALDKTGTHSNTNNAQAMHSGGGMHGGGMRGGGGRGGGGFNGSSRGGGGNNTAGTGAERASLFEKTSFKQKIRLTPRPPLYK
jgi:hypothetical protein